jgi:lipid-binding SYLF domain-containing protein
MKIVSRAFGLAPVLLLLLAGMAHAEHHDGKYGATISLFKNAGQCAGFFSRSYAYAVFPTVGEGGLGVGGAYGKGRVYVHGLWVGNTTMGQVSIGFQAGGKAYSQIIFFEDKRALDEFESGSFEFSAGASAVAITAGASASAGTSGASAGASAGKKDARDTGVYEKGMAVFSIAKGGLMYAATLAGQKFSYEPRNAQ